MKFYFINDKNNMYCKISGPAGLQMLEIANKMTELGYRPTNRIKYLGFTFIAIFGYLAWKKSLHKTQLIS